MNRRELLKRIPAVAAIPAVSAVAAIDLADGKVKKFEPAPGHYIFVIDIRYMDPDDLMNMPGLLPPGATGGWIVSCQRPPDEVFKIYRLDEE